MDLVLGVCDRYLFSPYVYPASWHEADIYRQTLSLFFITMIGGWLLYFTMATFSYLFVFEHRLMKHPQFLPRQILLEILVTSKSVPFMALLTVGLFVLEVRGYSNLYDAGTPGWRGGWTFIVFSVVAFLMFTDCLIYWIHRFLHHRLVYKYVHKDHHRWKVPTPFASHAFHPLDGFLQSVPYHIYPFLFPLHKAVYLALFVFVNVWTVSIHDGDYRVPMILRPFINGSAHHTDHHLFYNYNYGQFFTLWDRLCGSYRYPSAFEGKLLLDEVKLEEKQH